MPSVNAEWTDATIAHRLALLRFEEGATRDMLRAYDIALRDVDAKFKRLAERVRSGASMDKAGLERLVILGTDLQRRVIALRETLTKDLAGRLSEAADAEQRFTASLARNVGISFATVPESAVASMLIQPLGGNRWTERLAIDLFTMQEEIRFTIATVAASGASIPNVARALKRGTDLVQTYRGRMTNIARTEVQRVANTVALATYRENLDVIAGVQWLATLDSRTCLQCAPLHNRVWYYVDGHLPSDFVAPPLHPSCRCFVSPQSKGWRDLGIKVPAANRDRFTTTPAKDTDFDSWLGRQSRAKQLGFFDSETRLRAWKGGMPLGSFTGNGRVLNLGELRARYPGEVPA